MWRAAWAWAALALLAATVTVATAQDGTDAPTTQAPATTTSGLTECYYCGVGNLCDHPFEEKYVGRTNKTMTMMCTTSCFKFDGWTDDGVRVIVRDCGFFDADECTDNKDYELNSAVGTICHCKGDKCNGADAARGPAATAVAMAFVISVLTTLNVC